MQLNPSYGSEAMAIARIFPVGLQDEKRYLLDWTTCTTLVQITGTELQNRSCECYAAPVETMAKSFSELKGSRTILMWS